MATGSCVDDEQVVTPALDQLHQPTQRHQLVQPRRGELQKLFDDGPIQFHSRSFATQSFKQHRDLVGVELLQVRELRRGVHFQCGQPGPDLDLLYGPIVVPRQAESE